MHVTMTNYTMMDLSMMHCIVMVKDTYEGASHNDASHNNALRSPVQTVGNRLQRVDCKTSYSQLSLLGTLWGTSFWCP